jgi:AmmeMemoRadiSam system protein B
MIADCRLLIADCRFPISDLRFAICDLRFAIYDLRRGDVATDGAVVPVRPAAVAGTWYPGSAAALGHAVDGYLSRASGDAPDRFDPLIALIAPHAGLVYSGPVAAHAYGLLPRRIFNVIVLVGPSHFVGFEGVAIYSSGGFQTPFGIAPIDERCAADIMQAAPIVRENHAAHAREHSLEMQLPFVQRLAPATPVVPLVMGFQTAATARALGDSLGTVLAGRRALLVASTDLSHYHDTATAARLDGVVLDHVARFDTGGLERLLDLAPDHACGGGPMVAVMRAAHALGARHARVLDYKDSGDASGDKTSVVGYMAAALGVITEK